MRALFVFVLIFSTNALLAQEPTQEALVKAWEKSWNTYNLNEVKRLFVNDLTVTYFSSERNGLIHGIDSLVKHHRGFGFVEGGKDSANRLWLSEVSHRPLSVTATWHFQRPGSPEQRGPVTFILQFDGKAYRIAHAHFSNDPKGR